MAESPAAPHHPADATPSGVLTPTGSAIRLGWQLATVYLDPPPAQPGDPAPAPPHLPGTSEIGAYRRGKMLVGEIEHDLQALTTSLGLDPQNLATVTALKEEGVDPATTRSDVLTVYQSLLVELAAVAPHLQVALGLGRMLADTTLMPDPAQPGTYEEHFDPARLENAYGWLGDLHEDLPEHAAGAVSGSLKAWAGWVGDPAHATALTDKATRSALRTQGKLWRQLLCGDKQAADLLQSDDYAEASSRMIEQFRGVLFRFFRRWWAPIAGVVLVAVLVTVLGIWLLPDAALKVTTVLVAAAGALGITWKTVSSTVGRALATSREELWNAEVTRAIVAAATIGPPAAAPTGRPAA
ncbi:hypothetical protein [Microbacterium capsulatum]|uniref:Uncharacterized protein n=1 Tax=Microbacterium capsulatum TaxID=3041921 RepID=A0ABU0XL36_9MICO|nr:hypothetical protein [Microbacterium sp. ASV81]MDQ4215843.1 hypothetical protein [Microbacterium sp. ASV81]